MNSKQNKQAKDSIDQMISSILDQYPPTQTRHALLKKARRFADELIGNAADGALTLERHELVDKLVEAFFAGADEGGCA
ncbi:hypothetical protein [Methylococcus sp. EFPC2]|uniref:hypothetical protein n=1 Tax=Methylococcus sp. EFPC2 TaxID=2812648 RepID=UPI001966E28B|nr:hypothetical protein [Methylococcus sp. EFPC2]QSA98615.1 hypothetical protein JWZ97_07430 [Methylococcus sp. EFPC2]